CQTNLPLIEQPIQHTPYVGKLIYCLIVLILFVILIFGLRFAYYVHRPAICHKVESIKESFIKSPVKLEAVKQKIVDKKSKERKILNNFIRGALVKGYNKEQIKKSLIKRGWPKNYIIKYCDIEIKIIKAKSAAISKKISWKMERRKKYSKTADKDVRPKAGIRKRIWVKGYKTKEGKYIKGRYRINPYYKEKNL
ncbi:MAG: hypothetical protein P9L97_03940, partial [Candidatus Tenebribacter davisii]|nr:hypothetical protein [Candidatus Tenebribacter davisii]